MNIAVGITDLTRKGGTERTVVNLANYLRKQSHNITVISFNSKNGSPFFELSSDITVIHLGLTPYRGQKSYIKWKCYIANMLKAVSKLRLLKYDVVIGSSRNVNIMLLLFHVGSHVLGCEHFSFNAPVSPIVKLIRNVGYRHLDRLVVLTPKDAEYYAKRKVKTSIIVNALPFSPEVCESKEKIVLAVGRHSPEKAFDKLIKIWGGASCKDWGWKLYIVGDGPLLGENKKVAEGLHLKDSVKFIPPTSQIADYYRKSSIYAMTSLYEALPMVLLEAKSFQVPLISYDCETGPRAIIKNGIDGFLVSVGSESCFREKLDLLASDDKLRVSMGEMAYKDSLNYSSTRVMPLWNDLLNSL